MEIFSTTFLQFFLSKMYLHEKTGKFDDAMFIVNGYCNINAGQWIPNVIAGLICKYYNIYVTFKVFSDEFEEISKGVNNFVNVCSSFLFTQDGRLYVTGFNDSGKLGTMQYDNGCHQLREHDFFNTNNDNIVKMVSAGVNGYHHTFILTSQNELYSFGCNYHYQLGKVTLYQEQFTPTLVSYHFDSSLKCIQCGAKHTLLLTNNGYLYGCGSNICGQLSLNNSTTYTICLLDYFKNISTIACCKETSYATENIQNETAATIYSFGSNDEDVLGIGDTSATKKVNVIGNNIITNSVNHIATGYEHVGILTNNNKLYMFGRNDDGECGNYDERSNNDTIKVPTQVILNNNSDNNIQSIKCGGYHTIIKTKKNQYYTCGFNKGNRCLMNNEQKYLEKIVEPTLVSMKYLKANIGSNNPIIDLLPTFASTFIIQQN